ncbi:MAG: zinc-dependent peptidase [Chromatiales bacterium]
MQAVLVIGLVTAALIAAVLAVPWLRHRRRAHLLATEFPSSWDEILARTLPVYRRLPADLKTRLQQALLVFLAEKEFIGCAGLTITDEIRLMVGAQACLLIVNKGIEHYDRVRSILLYPAAFITEHELRDDAGVHTWEQKVLSGESWTEGKVILSWDDIQEGLEAGEEAYNVVYHEFAHQLDQADGDANGAPLLDNAESYRRWSAVFREAFEHLQQAIDNDEDTLLPEEAAENPGEFFAVATEVFMEQPVALRERHPPLYRELSSFYRLDPAAWAGG